MLIDKALSSDKPNGHWFEADWLHCKRDALSSNRKVDGSTRRDGTKPIPSTRSIGYRVNFKVSVSPKNPIPIPSPFRYYFDTFSILYMYGYFNIKLQ